VEGAAVVVDNYTHGIVALVGGRAVDLEGFVRATQARRQPGSSFKPVVYAAALEHGLTQFSTVLDGPLEISTPVGMWRPQNDSGSFAGVIRLRDAFARSLNTAAVRLAIQTGAEPIARLGAQLGVETPLRPDLSIALGASEVTPLDQARVVHALVSGGLRHDLRLMERLDSLDHRHWTPGDLVQVAPGDVRVLPGGPPVRAVDGAVAAQVVAMMHRVVAIGTAKDAASERGPRIAKTGTSSDFVDAWLIGATPHHTVVVWLGSDDRTPLGHGETGGKAALPAWVAIADALDQDGGQFTIPGSAILVSDGQSLTAMPRTRAAARRLHYRVKPGALPPFPGADQPPPEG
jgi:penicillin-binding protein 1A